MTPEHSKIPDWAHQENQALSGWEELDVFWFYASLAFENVGRGAVVVDTRARSEPGKGYQVGYFSQERIEANALTTSKHERIKRMVTEYQPTEEYVLVLFRPGDVVSSYRIGIVPSEPWDETAPAHTKATVIEPGLTPPDMETLMEWDAAGGCEAACSHGCWVEQDGACPHGQPSWMLKLGLI